MRKLARRAAFVSWNRMVWQVAAHCRRLEYYHDSRRIESTGIANPAVIIVKAQPAC